MNQDYQLIITVPSGEAPLIPFGSHFCVNGLIRHEKALPEDAVLTVSLLDSDGRVVRDTKQTKKNNASLYTSHPALTLYPAGMDEDLSRLKAFGFAELMVSDTEHPLDSLRNATLKCFYSDSHFKAIIVSATDVAHGAAFNDGMGFTDGEGKPYRALLCGFYTARAELTLANGERLAMAEKRVEIGAYKKQSICRFNPTSHKENMIRWCEEIGCPISKDPLPGYLDPYLGVWYYHMGLLPMYRANDLAFYGDAEIHMFVYLIDPTSTSYETELAYLQTKGRVGDAKRFFAYRYDIGEARIGEGKPWERRGRILPFAEGEYLSVCRVDVVNEQAKENFYDLRESGVKRSLTDRDALVVSAGERIALMGVARPWQMEPSDFLLREDNTYEIRNSVDTVRYTVDDGDRTITETRSLMLERADGESIGRSVYEFYNLFEIPADAAGKTLTFTVTACDRKGADHDSTDQIRIRVV